MSRWTGDEVALGADVIRQMWKATDPILEKLSCEGTRMTAIGGISSSGETTIEGDIVIRDSELTDPMLLDAHLANPNRLWPSGVVEYRYYHLL